MNTSATAIDPGPNGLHLPLADHALSAQAGPQNPPNVTVLGHEVVVEGPIAPGDTEMQVVFALAYEGGSLEFTQHTPLPFEEVAFVTEKIDGMTVEGNSPRDRGSRAAGAQARALSAARARRRAAPSQLHVRGLPHNDPTWRYLAVGVALMLLVGFGVYASRGAAAARRRASSSSSSASTSSASWPRSRRPTAATSASARSRS